VLIPFDALLGVDGDIGLVHDFIIEPQTWTIRYLVINAHHWRPGKKTLIATQWVESICSENSNLTVNVGRDTIKESPEYDDHTTITRDYELTLFAHYHRKGYWFNQKPEIKPDEASKHVPTLELTAKRKPARWRPHGNLTNSSIRFRMALCCPSSISTDSKSATRHF
jgi:hypothetical protein